jgi:hypothetical protein
MTKYLSSLTAQRQVVHLVMVIGALAVPAVAQTTFSTSCFGNTSVWSPQCGSPAWQSLGESATISFQNTVPLDGTVFSGPATLTVRIDGFQQVLTLSSSYNFYFAGGGAVSYPAHLHILAPSPLSSNYTILTVAGTPPTGIEQTTTASSAFLWFPNRTSSPGTEIVFFVATGTYSAPAPPYSYNTLGVGVVFTLEAQPLCLTNVRLSVSGPYMQAKATFPSAPNSSTLLRYNDAVAACDFDGFNWQQQITTDPGGDAIRPNEPSNPLLASNLLLDGSLAAGPSSATGLSKNYPAYYDPPPGGYTYQNLGLSSYPFFYPSSFFKPGPEGHCTVDPLFGVLSLCPFPWPYVLSSDSLTISFLDAPAHTNLKGVAAAPNPKPGTFLEFRTALVGISTQPKQGSVSCGAGNTLYCTTLSWWTWNSTFNDRIGGVSGISQNAGIFAINPTDGTGGVTITSINGIQQTPPSVTCTANPNILWPPNGKSVPVTVSGIITPGTQTISPGSTAYAVLDEYGQVQPSGGIAPGAGGTYAFAASLIAARNGNDQDGRTYTISVGAKDAVGNIGTCSTVVTVPHDQGN